MPSQKTRGRGPQPLNTFEAKRPAAAAGRGGPAWGGAGGQRPAARAAQGSAAYSAPPSGASQLPQPHEAAKGDVYPSEEKFHPVLAELKKENEYNPGAFTLQTRGARFFVIKSYSEDDIHRAIKYNVWCSTEHGNKRLDSAFREREGKGPVYLFYSVNGSGHFCGVAEMASALDYSDGKSVWTQDKWKGKFKVKWIYVKDVPNQELRHIRLENNDNKPVTNSRDTQEVPYEKGKVVLDVIHHYKHQTCIFDDFGHYEKRQEEETTRKPTRR